MRIDEGVRRNRADWSAFLVRFGLDQLGNSGIRLFGYFGVFRFFGSVGHLQNNRFPLVARIPHAGIRDRG